MPRPWSEQRKKRLSALQAAGRGADEIATALGLRREQVVARLKLIASWERNRENFAAIPCLNDSAPGMLVIWQMALRELKGWA